MKIRRFIALTAFAAAVLVPTAVRAGVEAADEQATAIYQGPAAKLADGWGDATACFVEGDQARCYESEDDLVSAEGISDEEGSVDSGSVAALSSCSSSTRLYDGTSYGGSVLYLYSGGTFYNLATLGFSNRTSSYQIGSCAATFYDSSSGGSPVYPGYTGAYASASSMAGGWDNRVSGVYAW